MEIGAIAELLLVLAVAIVILMCLPAAVFNFLVDALLITWAGEIMVLALVFASILLRKPKAA